MESASDNKNDSSGDVELARWVVIHADQAFAELAESDSGARLDAFQLASNFRKAFGSERSPLLCELYAIRQRATAKFKHANEMFFTRVGYEQSTSQAIAEYKAKRFTGLGKVVDLCSGIGGDALSLASVVGQLSLVDLSPTTLEFAKANLERASSDATMSGRAADTEYICGDLRSVDLSSFAAWHIDPDRRVDGQRRSAPNACEPPLDEFLQLPGLAEHGAIKLSPAAEVDALLERGAELEWIGNHGECQQLVAWFGDLAKHPGKRVATWLSGKPNESNGVSHHFMSGESQSHALRNDSGEVSVFSACPTYVYEPRPSVLAADLVEELAQQFGLERLASKSVYLAANQPIELPLLRRFEVIEILPYHMKTLKRRVRELGLRVTEVKKRGVEISPDRVLRALSGTVDNDARSCVLLMYPAGRSIQALFAMRAD